MTEEEVAEIISEITALRGGLALLIKHLDLRGALSSADLVADLKRARDALPRSASGLQSLIETIESFGGD